MRQLRNKLKSINILRKIWAWYVFKRNFMGFMINPKMNANRLFKKTFNRNIEWDNPSNLIEKIYWLLFNTDTTIWSELADKYAVRNYIAKKGFSYLLNELYGSYENPSNIDYDCLPNEFVIKTNNACETVLLVRDKSKLEVKKTKKQLNAWLQKPYGVMNSQFHYLKIPPKIIIEKYLHNQSAEMNSLVDYKFLCFYGIPECVLVVSERNAKTHSYLLNLYDHEWNSLEKHLSKNKSIKEYPKPISFQEMISICNILAKDIPVVRIDFYEIEGRPVFGEFSFTTGYGYYTEEYYNYLGNKIDLTKIVKTL